MAYYVAMLNMLDPARNQEVRPAHLAYLKKCEDEGKLFTCGAFADGSGGMVIYIADSHEEAVKIASEDPYVIEKVRELHLREWRKTQL